jgi:aryl-alcohol dehydrogenase-like predicted oxidoreductase
VAAAKVPKAAPALARWHAWCGKRGLAPLQAALSVVKGFPGASHCVVGVDHAGQLEAIASAWDAVHPLDASELATPDAEVIDPRRWPAREAV